MDTSKIENQEQFEMEADAKLTELFKTIQVDLEKNDKEEVINHLEVFYSWLMDNSSNYDVEHIETEFIQDLNLDAFEFSKTDKVKANILYEFISKVDTTNDLIMHIIDDAWSILEKQSKKKKVPTYDDVMEKAMQIFQSIPDYQGEERIKMAKKAHKKFLEANAIHELNPRDLRMMQLLVSHYKLHQ